MATMSGVDHRLVSNVPWHPVRIIGGNAIDIHAPSYSYFDFFELRHQCNVRGEQDTGRVHSSPSGSVVVYFDRHQSRAHGIPMRAI